jgi:hypothetical protein
VRGRWGWHGGGQNVSAIFVARVQRHPQDIAGAFAAPHAARHLGNLELVFQVDEQCQEETAGVVAEGVRQESAGNAIGEFC